MKTSRDTHRSSLSAALLTIAALSVLAGVGCAPSTASVDTSTTEAESALTGAAWSLSNSSGRFNVSFAAYRGELEAQGIPRYQTFCNQLNWGQLSAQTVAIAAADAGLITTENAKTQDLMWSFKLELLSRCR